MKINLGNLDRAFRFMLGIALIIFPLATNLPFFDGALLVWGAVATGIVLLATVFFKFCPIYGLLGMNSCRA